MNKAQRTSVSTGRAHSAGMSRPLLKLGGGSAVSPLAGECLARAGGQPAQKRLVALARVPADDAPQRGIGFQRGRVKHTIQSFVERVIVSSRPDWRKLLATPPRSRARASYAWGPTKARS